MEAFIGSLATAAVGALAWMAYQHPKSYEKFSNILMVCCFFGVSLLIAWVAGVNYTVLYFAEEIANTPGLGTVNLSGPRAAVRADLIPPIWLGLAMPIGFVTYLWFLQSLPFWLLKDRQQKSHD